MYRINGPVTKEDRLEDAIQWLEGIKTEIAGMNAFKLQEVATLVKGFPMQKHTALHHAGFGMEIIGDAIEILKDVQAQNRADQEKRTDQDQAGD